MEKIEKKKFFVRDKDFYKSFTVLTLVISLNSMITFSVNLADNIMLGRFSENALSAAALVNQIQFLLQMIVFGVGNGVVVLGAQYWGKRETEPIRKILSVGMKFSIVIGLVFMLLGRLIPEQLVYLLADDKSLIEEGAKYMRIMCYTYLVYSVSNTLVMSLRSVEVTVIGTVMSCVTLIINICLNYCFIFGNFGAPRLGIVGAAIATLTSRTVELIIIFIYVLCIDKKLKARLRDIFGFNTEYLKDFIKISTPVILSGAAWGFTQMAQTAVLGHLGRTAIAANSIAAVVYQLAAVIALSAANSSSVIIGKTIGAGRDDMIRPYTRTLQVLFIGIGILSCILMLILKDIFIQFYNVTPETQELANSFMVILSITVLGTAYEYPVMGIIQGGGDTKYSFILDTASWCIGIPLAALSAYVFNWPVIVTFFILKMDQLWKCIPNFLRCNHYKWVRQLTR